jgi:exoribonuclease-2
MSQVTRPPHLDLPNRAKLEMVEAGFTPYFEPAVQESLKQVIKKQPADADGIADLRSLLWSSIDNPDSLDLDQIEYVEKLADGNVRVLIGIADVDFYVQKDSPIDQHAAHNTTSVYTGVITFPMLPNELSTNLTSLVQAADRCAIVIDLEVNSAGAIIKSSVYPALVRNHAKLDYPTVGGWLENGGTVPDKIVGTPGLVDQLKLQNEVQAHIAALRKEHGSLILETIETEPVSKQGQIIDLQLVEANPARELIENFMIAGNIAVSHFLVSKGIPSIRRVVKEPERWPRIVEVAAEYDEKLPPTPDAKALSDFLSKRKAADPLHFPDLSLTIVKLLGPGEYVVDIPGQADQGHFALAVHDYTHATAPNRRYADLVTERLLKSAIAGKPVPYSVDELNDVSLQCTRREKAAKKVERTVRKVVAAELLSKHIGETYDGIVTGVKDDDTYVRLLKPPVEGKIVQGGRGLEVGQQVQVRLLSTNADKAYIDFAYVGKSQPPQ